MNKISQVAFILITFFITTMISSSAIAEKIKIIDVQGNHRVETSTIAEYLGVSVGDTYSLELESKAIKSLYSTSLFENIDIKFHEGTFKVHVLETPFVSKIEFKGNYKINTKLLSKAITTSPGDNLEKSSVRTDIERIREMYKRSGRFSAHVESKVETLENNRVKVIFNINEGPKTGIKRIYFVGNDNYKSTELRSMIMTKESRWWSFLETNDTYDPERLEYDKHLLTQFYNSVGFADFNIISVTADLLSTKEGFVVTYSIEEGKKYVFGKITLDNKLPSVRSEDLAKFISQREGKTFNLTAMERISDKISDYLALQGFAQVDVRPSISQDVDTGIVDVSIVVDHADKVFVNKININGNVKTEDHVIRREFKISEGDVFNREKIERGERGLRNLDYFEKVALKMKPTDKNDRYNIDIDVSDKSTSSLGMEMGYNTAGGPFGRLTFLEKNLVGTGKHLNAGIQVGNKSISYFGGLTDPHFMDKDLSLGLNLSRKEDGRGSGFSGTKQKYESISNSAKISAGYDITDDLSHVVDYSYKEDKLKSASESSSLFIKENLGQYTTSALSHTLTYDMTDSRVLPKNGYIVSGTQEFAGVGGNTKYLKHEFDGKIFKSFINNNLTLKLAATGGHIKGLSGKKIRIPERFNLGDYSLRGFSPSGIGPRDKDTDEAIGGQNFYTISAELSFPVGLPEEFNVTGSVFVDTGALWGIDSKPATPNGFHNDKSLRTSVGFGVLWVTRFAPIRMDWGFPIVKKRYDDTQTFHIKFSTSL